MHAAAWRTLRASHQLHSRPACRRVAGIRHPPARSFHPSAAASIAPEDPAGAAASERNDDANKSEGSEDLLGLESEAVDGVRNTMQSNDISPRSGQRLAPGSSTRRTSKNKATTGLPPLIFPDWFWEKNVTCFGEPEDLTRWVEIEHDVIEDNIDDVFMVRKELIRSFELQVRDIQTGIEETMLLLKDLVKSRAQHLESVMKREGSRSKQPLESSWHDKIEIIRRHAAEISELSNLKNLTNSKSLSRYSLHPENYAEIYAAFCGELRLAPPRVNLRAVNRQDTILMFPRDVGLKFIDAVVQSVGTTLNADVIRIDAEDIAQIVGEYVGEDVAWTKSPTAVLGYGRLDKKLSALTMEAVNDDEDGDDFIKKLETNLSVFSPESTKGGKGLPINAGIAFLQAPSKLFQGRGLSKIMNLGNLLGQSANPGPFATQSAKPVESWNDYKIGYAMDAIIGAADAKRARSVGTAEAPKPPVLSASKGLIIQVRGYKELNDHPVGNNLLRRLREGAKKRWFEGRSVMVVGTTGDNAKTSSERVRNFIRIHVSSSDSFDKPRIIFVPPRHSSGKVPSDREADTRDLNVRHIEHMIRKLVATDYDSQWEIDIKRNSCIGDMIDIKSRVWGYDNVRRVAITMLGIAGSDRLIDGSTLRHALVMHDASGERILRWAEKEEPVSKPKESENAVKSGKKSSTVNKETEEDEDTNLEMLQVLCTGHEKKLLGSVIKSSDIQTTFADVRAPTETIEALKTLTSLSLIRPDSFSYGVLATDKIPGVLLYGPPGTGKTLLAKAVAKESGATMLEVSASEINDMYVGEGEKNVKALFSLAKKLAPCVVFIDEADSLFGSRGGTFQRKSHREIINQFLREWDGMANLSAFIMVATNRPFDLDEAVLRRLPRRLLVDLPGEKDREAILQIHLKDEILEESISLAALAKQTQLYSGSDLKNLSVAAALACVREENEMAAKHSGDEPYVYPPKRILRKSHFDIALGEISASISEDMSTLRAIKVFDEKYGDRKGRPKKAGIGFGGTKDGGPDAEAGRVRKSEPKG